jgi:tartrate-resistant acid phosphatase type 5
MSHSPVINRRRAIQTLFCSSAAMALNLRPSALAETPSTAANALNFICIGDFGTGSVEQKGVAAAMKAHVEKWEKKPDAMLMLGDTFYTEDTSPGGFSIDSPRWKNEVEDMYPTSHFPGPMHSILGNHDYHDNEHSVQLAYAKKPGVRWNLPSKWYRLDLGSPQPLVTFLCVDTNLYAVSGKGKKDKKTGKTRASLSLEDEVQQMNWLLAELEKPRAPFTVILGHHPVYSEGGHGDTEALSGWHDLMNKYKVHAYLGGHDHDLQHLELEDSFTSYVISGGGGAMIRKVKDKRQMPFGRMTYGFTQLSVTPEQMRFTHFDNTGAQIHTFAKKLDGSIVIG